MENVRVKTDATNSVITDSGGAFALVGLETGNHLIRAQACGYTINAVSLDCPTTQNIQLDAVPMGRDMIASDQGIVLEGDDQLSTPSSFRPPVEITIVAKTRETNLRMAYAADQVIFNWEANSTELRVDGGPANAQHRPGAGAIPRDEYVAIRWVVTPKRQSIFVNNELRFTHSGDYSQIDRPVSVFTYESTVTVKLIEVKRLH